MHFRLLCWNPHLQAWFNRDRQESHSSMPEAKDRDSWQIWKLHCSHLQHSTALDLSESAPAISEKSHALLHATCLATSNDSKSIPVSHKITYKKSPFNLSGKASRPEEWGCHFRPRSRQLQCRGWIEASWPWHLWAGATEWDQLSSSRPKNTGNQRSHR